MFDLRAHQKWELNSGPLEEQPVLFATKPSLQPLLLLLLTQKFQCVSQTVFNSYLFYVLCLD